MSVSIIVRLTIMLLAVIVVVGCGKKKEEDQVEYTTSDGKKTSDVRTIKDGRAEYQVTGGQSIPLRAQQLHQEARAKGASGDYKAAITLLKQATEIAPKWPYPYYDMAFTYLLQGDNTNALLKYQEVDRMEPKGFFTAKTAVWTLEREDRKVFPTGTYLTFLSLEWVDSAKKRDLIERLTTDVPAFAPAWKEKALLEQSADERLAFLDKALSLDPDPETYGICMLNKAALLYKSGKITEATQMARDLSTNSSSTQGTKTMAEEFLKTLKKE